ncbi:MAG: hypothetical protein MUF31_04740 [Akkermansiaceae bacterium]|jgi:hypothetical protein|nr:hypothetical protein [Akkermansiaceae bacterium]
MKPTPTLLAAALVASTAAFIAGRMTAPDAEASASGSETSERISARGDRSGAESAAPSRELRDNGSSRGDRPPGMESATDEMLRIMDGLDPLARTQAWLDFINSLDATEFEGVVARFREEGLTQENMAEYALLLTAWAKVDALAALDYAKANTGNSFARNTILTAWAQTDPQGAIAWARQNHEGEGANPWMVGVIRGLVASDPALATQLMMEMPRSRERGDALVAILPKMLEQGTDAAKGWVGSIADESLRDGAVRMLSEQLARKDPADAAEWLTSMGGEAAQRGLDDIVSSWASTDRDAAVAYFDRLPQGEARSNALRGLTNQLALDDPQAAAQFLDQHSGDANDRVYQQFVWHSFGSDPALAANYISRISNERERDGMYRRMLDGWLRRDFDAATQWMSSADLPENVVNRMNERIQEMQERQQ